MTDMTVAQVAEVCGVTERTVRRWLKEGRLAGVRVGSRVRISAHAVGELAAPYGETAASPVRPNRPRPRRGRMIGCVRTWRIRHDLPRSVRAAPLGPWN